MTLVNVISDSPAEHIKNSVIFPSEGGPVSFVYSEWAREADWYVIFDTARRISLPKLSRNVVFLPAEPPEIVEYREQDLIKIPILGAPHFPQFTKMSNWRPMHSYWPLLVAIDKKRIKVDQETSSNSVATNKLTTRRGISMLISNKSQTPMQRWRRRLARELRDRVPEVDVFIGGVKDKGSCLDQYSYHIAIENSVHQGYFTEKLIEPLMLGAIPIYAGSPRLPDELENLIKRIEPYDTEAAIQVIAALVARSASGESSLAARVEEWARREGSRYTLEASVGRLISNLAGQPSRFLTGPVSEVHVRRRWKKPRAHLRNIVSRYHVMKIPRG